VAFFFLEKTMHPYQILCYLLHEYKQASDELDDDGALKIAMQIREAAHQLVVRAAESVKPPVDPRQLKLPLKVLL
jgi:hypothetical protein